MWTANIIAVIGRVLPGSTKSQRLYASMDFANDGMLSRSVFCPFGYYINVSLNMSPLEAIHLNDSSVKPCDIGITIEF